jgi:RloB-like protein
MMQKKQEKRRKKSLDKCPPWRSPFEEKRKIDEREERDRILIVCEGARTEPLYFEGFRIPISSVKVLGVGMNTLSVVKEAIRLRDEATKRYEQVWCVFDRDNFTSKRFNQALDLAKQNGINVAYTNQAFELWYLLHYHYHDAATSRDLYKKMLTERMGRKYKKKDSTMYQELLDKMDDAIRNAKRLSKSHGKNHNPEKDNPSTTVHLLVELLCGYQD